MFLLLVSLLCVMWEMVWASFRGFYCKLLRCVYFPEGLLRHFDCTRMLGLIVWVFRLVLRNHTRKQGTHNVYSSILTVPFQGWFNSNKHLSAVTHLLVSERMSICTPLIDFFDLNSSAVSSMLRMHTYKILYDWFLINFSSVEKGGF